MKAIVKKILRPVALALGVHRWIRKGRSVKGNGRISEYYLRQQKELHFWGDYGIGANSEECAALVRRLVPRGRTVLDYGSGKHGHMKRLLGNDYLVCEYDPCIPGKDAEPFRSSVVVCSDVLEHIEPGILDAVLRHIHEHCIDNAIFVIATTPAVKTLSDGRNAHLIIQSMGWWQRRLFDFFNIDTTSDRTEENGTILIIARPKRLLKEK